MAEIDLSEIIDDAMLTDVFLILRTIEVVGLDGMAMRTSMQIYAYGIVQPAGGSTLNMLPDDVRSQEVIEVWTPYDVKMATDQTDADVVQWNDKHYIVTQAQDWTSWGEGFVHAVCTRIELQGQPAPL